MIDSKAIHALENAIDSKIAKATRTKTSRISAEVLREDADGTVWVHIPGGAEETPVTNCTVAVKSGDLVNVIIANGRASIDGNVTDPSPGTEAVEAVEETAKDALKKAVRAGENVDAAKEAAAAAQQAAAEAEAAIRATNQHFWHNENGAHVTDIEKDVWLEAEADDFSDCQPDPLLPNYKPWYSLLLNTLGQVFRSGAKTLASFTHSAIAFFDGEGNNAENIVAQFGKAGAQIGASSDAHANISRRLFSLTSHTAQRMFGVSSTSYDIIVEDERETLNLTLSRMVVEEKPDPADYTDLEWLAFYEALYIGSFVVPIEFDITDWTLSWLDGTTPVESVEGESRVPSLLNMYGITENGYGVALGLVDVDGNIYDVTEITDGSLYYLPENGTMIESVYFRSNVYGGTTGEEAVGDMFPQSKPHAVVGHTIQVQTEVPVSYPWLHFGDDDNSDKGMYSSGFGQGLKHTANAQCVVGRYNANSANNLFEIGNGTSNSARSNAMTVSKAGYLTAASGASFSGEMRANSVWSKGVLYVGNSSQEVSLYAKLKSSVRQWVRVINGDANGAALLLQGGGLTIVGGGESANNLYSALGSTATSEHMHVAADGTTYIHSNCNTIADRKTWTFSTGGAMYPPGVPAAVGDKPSATQYGIAYYLRDKKDAVIGVSRARITTAGAIGHQLYAQRTVSGNPVYHGFSMNINADGTRTVTFDEAAPWRTGLGLGSFATKSSVSYATTGKDGTGKNTSQIAANGTVTIQVTLTAPANSVLSGIVRLSCSTWSLVSCGWLCSNYNTVAGTVTVDTYWRNVTSTAVAANGATVTVTGQFIQKQSIS